ncbi:hypothetical protein AX15_001276 [Amanita polypyramis BW_CC]|nr:hypothetical protein AX15_001276 [Amanita polypyramis BW_CC]
MRLFPALFHAFVRSGTQAAASVVPIPGLVAVAELLSTIVVLDQSLRRSARQLAIKCRWLYDALEQYERKPLPDRTDRYRDSVMACLQQVEQTMKKWSQKKSLQMFLHQGDFEQDINDCNDKISTSLSALLVGANLETLVWQKEDEKWKRDFRECLDEDNRVILKLLSNENLVRQASEFEILENQNEMRGLLEKLQKSLAEKESFSKEERDRVESNLYDLLRMSGQLPPHSQLDSGEVQWTDRIPVSGSRNVDIYKGRYLQREDVMIKVIRSVKMDEQSLNRIKREIQLWATIYERDKGKHIIPFYGFWTVDGVRLALISPWIDNGDALTFVKRNDNIVNYRKLIRGIAEGIQVLHSMDPPIIHGELRAEKILIGDKGQPLLTDFALAQIEGTSITQTVGIADYYRWCAPEMCAEPGTVSTKSDIYSLAMTTLELLTHEKPFARLKRGVHVIRKMEMGERPDRPDDKHAIERGLDEKMWELLWSCWAPNGEDRPSIDELISRL